MLCGVRVENVCSSKRIDLLFFLSTSSASSFLFLCHVLTTFSLFNICFSLILFVVHSSSFNLALDNGANAVLIFVMHC